MALLALSSAPAGAAEGGQLHMRCTNPTGGASWTISVDLDHSQVDGFSATISDKWVRWRDPGQGWLDLERATGALQVRNVSSTGGYFLHYTCKPE